MNKCYTCIYIPQTSAVGIHVAFTKMAADADRAFIIFNLIISVIKIGIDRFSSYPMNIQPNMSLQIKQSYI